MFRLLNSTIAKNNPCSIFDKSSSTPQIPLSTIFSSKNLSTAILQKRNFKTSYSKSKKMSKVSTKAMLKKPVYRLKMLYTKLIEDISVA